MKQKIFFIILALLLFIPACKSKSPTSPDDVETTGTISGTVTAAGTGTAISGASVSTQPATSTATTNAQGSYTISNVSPGSYTVTATAGGYMAGTANATVAAGQTATANVALQADYSGSWSGTTSQGKSISFTIVNNAFTYFSFGWSVSGTYCSSYGTTNITYTTPKPITGNTFTISGSFSYGYPSSTLSYTFNGTFNSSTTASGTATFTSSGGCSASGSATWSANKT